MFQRAYKDFRDENENDVNQTFAKNEKNRCLLVSSLIVQSACILCLLLDTKWPAKLNFIAKIPIYMIIAQAQCFTIVFGNFYNLL